MNKVKNKIMSAAAVINIVLCLMFPLFGSVVSAEGTTEQEVVYPPYTGIEIFEPHEDDSGFKLGDYISSVGGCRLPFLNHLTDYITEDEYKANWRQKVGSSYYDLPPYYGIKYTNGYRIINTNDDYYQFVSCLDYAHSYANTKINYTAEQEYYYFTFFITYKYDNPYRNEIEMYDRCFTFISETPFEVAENGDGNYYLTGSEMYYMVAVAQTIYYEDDNYYSVSFSNGAIRENKFLFDSNMNYVTSVSTDEGNYDYQCSKFYTNCAIDLSVFNNTDNLAYGISDLKQTKPSLSEQIDVKLTPEFGLDMDRTFDPLTGQNDYFKLEVTNNSETSVQFCCSITNKQTGTLENAIQGTILEGILQFDYKDWEDGYWNYISDTYYYADCYEVSEKFFGLAQDRYRRYAELQKGNFYWVLLKPGESFEDYVYWENVNIKVRTEYSFVVDCIPTTLEYPTDVFYKLEGDTKVFTHPDEFDDWQYSKDESLEQYALNYEECVQIRNYIFSVNSIPEFTTTIRGGNSKITSGWGDTAVQSSNPYYRKDLRTDEVQSVSNYQEFNGNLGDVNVDIDNVGIDDVKTYITYTQDFFNLLKMVLSFFPPFVWVIICFGLTAVVVVGIIKILK